MPYDTHNLYKIHFLIYCLKCSFCILPTILTFRITKTCFIYWLFTRVDLLYLQKANIYINQLIWRNIFAVSNWTCSSQSDVDPKSRTTCVNFHHRRIEMMKWTWNIRSSLIHAASTKPSNEQFCIGTLKKEGKNANANAPQSDLRQVRKKQTRWERAQSFKIAFLSSTQERSIKTHILEFVWVKILFISRPHILFKHTLGQGECIKERYL